VLTYPALPRPITVDANAAELTYPAVPRPTILDVVKTLIADTMKDVLTYPARPRPWTVDTKVDASVPVLTYPALPRPRTVDTMLEVKLAVLTYPRVPKEFTEDINCDVITPDAVPVKILPSAPITPVPFTEKTAPPAATFVLVIIIFPYTPTDENTPSAELIRVAVTVLAAMLLANIAWVDTDPLTILDAVSRWPMVAEFRTNILLPTPKDATVDAVPPMVAFPSVVRDPPTATDPVVLTSPPKCAAPPVDNSPPMSVELFTIAVNAFVREITFRVEIDSPDPMLILDAVKSAPTSKLHATATDENTDKDPPTLIELLKNASLITTKLELVSFI